MNEIESKLVNICYQNKLLLNTGEDGLRELKQGLELDSITYMSMLIKLEEEFDIEFSDSILTRNFFQCINELIKEICNNLKNKEEVKR